MKSTHLLQELEFDEKAAHAQPLYVDKFGRAIRFMLKPGQSLREHNAPTSPLYLVIVKGEGIFAGGDGKEERFGPNALLVFDPKENHAIRALDQELVFVTFLHGAPSNVSQKKGGVISRGQKRKHDSRCRGAAFIIARLKT
jgi:quercetin dioxygenase-like cupin family protein